MAEVGLLFGASGTGKSRSLINYAEDEILLINTVGKRLPFQKKFRNVVVSDSPAQIAQAMKETQCKTIIIDDSGYIMSNAFMRGHSKPKAGASSFDLYNDIADGFWSLINFCKKLPDDVIVFFIMHEETNDYGGVKLKTIGKLLDQKVCIEGLVTVCLRCIVDGNGKHVFRTQNDGNDIAKSPEGMFDMTIPNDLKFVTDTMRKYWEI